MVWISAQYSRLSIPCSVLVYLPLLCVHVPQHKPNVSCGINKLFIQTCDNSNPMRFSGRG